jgi:hypothetical protein
MNDANRERSKTSMKEQQKPAGRKALRKTADRPCLRFQNGGTAIQRECACSGCDE